jgi:hypothetical protein
MPAKANWREIKTKFVLFRVLSRAKHWKGEHSNSNSGYQVVVADILLFPMILVWENFCLD